MVDIRREFPRLYLTARDLDGAGRLVAQIVGAEILTFKAGEPPALMLTLRHRSETAPKTVRCNQTNRNALAAVWGFDTDEWLDKKIELSVRSTSMGPGVAIRPLTDDGDTAASPTGIRKPHRSRVEDDDVPY